MSLVEIFVLAVFAPLGIYVLYKAFQLAEEAKRGFDNVDTRDVAVPPATDTGIPAPAKPKRRYTKRSKYWTTKKTVKKPRPKGK